MKKAIAAILALTVTTSAMAAPVDESAKHIQDETLFLASQAIALWSEETETGDVFWISIHDHKINPDLKAFSARLRGYHKANRSVPHRLSVTEIGGICATRKIGVTNWRTYNAKGKMLEDHLGNVKDGAPFSWPMLDRILADLCVNGEARKP